jgi:hypothetical protein
MWFTKFLTKRRVAHLTRIHQDIPPHKANRQVVEDFVKELNPDFFTNYKPTMGKQRQGVFLYPNIENYTNKVVELTRLIKQEKPIATDWAEGVKEAHTSVDWFLTSADGYYINVHTAVHAFGQAVYNLCVALSPSDNVQYGVYEHNFRMLNKLFINLRSVMEDLIAVSLTKA